MIKAVARWLLILLVAIGSAVGVIMMMAIIALRDLA